MLVQPCEKEVYESSEVGDSSASAVGNVEVSVSTSEQPVTGEIAAEICEDRDALVGDVSETHNAVPEGYVDEGEEINVVVALLDLADQNALREDELLEESIAADGDADDEEEEAVEEEQGEGGCRVPLPDEWDRRDKASMVVHDGHRVQWEYGTNMIRVKQVFKSKSALKEVVCPWALSSMRE